MHKSPLPLDSQNWIWKMHLHVLGTGKNCRPGKMSWLFCLKVWAEFMYEDTYSSVIICLYATNTTSHTTSSVFVSLFPVHLLAFEWRSEGSLKITSESEDTGAYTIKLLHVCGDVAFEKRWACMLKKDKVEDVGGAGEGQPSDKSTPAYRTPTKCLAPACCLVWGREMRPVSMRGLAEWLHITLSAPATSHLYCNANPRPVPDGAFPASWVHRNMIIYPKHFSSL